MTALFLMLLSLALLAGFLFLARYESRRGERYLASARAHLDERVSRAAARLSDLDLEYTLKIHAKKGAERVLHDVAHYSLIAVRWIERTLTRAVRTMRARRAARASAPSPFAETMKDFKQELKGDREPSA